LFNAPNNFANSDWPEKVAGLKVNTKKVQLLGKRIPYADDLNSFFHKDTMWQNKMILKMIHKKLFVFRV